MSTRFLTRFSWRVKKVCMDIPYFGFDNAKVVDHTTSGRSWEKHRKAFDELKSFKTNGKGLIVNRGLYNLIN